MMSNCRKCLFKDRQDIKCGKCGITDCTQCEVRMYLIENKETLQRLLVT